MKVKNELPKENKKDPGCLWVFGNAVQDITVEVDLNTLSHEYSKIHELLKFHDQTLDIKSGLWLRTRYESHKYAVEMKIKKDDPVEMKIKKDDPIEGFYIIKPGSKYTLEDDIREIIPSPEDSHSRKEKKGDSMGVPPEKEKEVNLIELLSQKEKEGNLMDVPCDNISWGGGGVNVVTFIRAIAPNSGNVPIKYSDIAMSDGILELLVEFSDRSGKFKVNKKTIKFGRPNTTKDLLNLLKTKALDERLFISNIARATLPATPDRTLEIYLATLAVESVFHRPEYPRFRRNWVFSQFQSGKKVIDDKIIFRGNLNPLQDKEERVIAKLLNNNSKDVKAFLLNSLKDGPLFKAVYKLYRKKNELDKDVIGVFAMTIAMQDFYKWMENYEKKIKSKVFPPFIIVFDAEEAYEFAKKCYETSRKAKKKLNKINKFVVGNDDPPDIYEFAQIVKAIRSRFDINSPPRIYVTIGSRGSLGVNDNGDIIYVSSFIKPGKIVFDTNKCGDAYCAAIALLEWAKRNGYPKIAGIKANRKTNASTEEMRYFMAVATALASCKATNRRGRVYAAEVKDLLQHIHLASDKYPGILEYEKKEKEQQPENVDQFWRIITPPKAKLFTVTEDLKKLME